MKYIVTLNGKNYEVDVDKTDAVITSVTQAVPAPSVPSAAPAAPAPATTSAASNAVQSSAEGTKVTSPMPGTILSVNAAEGKSVKAGDVLLILEAMKMENEIAAPCDGTVKQLLVQKGSTVDTDSVLAVIG